MSMTPPPVEHKPHFITRFIWRLIATVALMALLLCVDAFVYTTAIKLDWLDAEFKYFVSILILTCLRLMLEIAVMNEGKPSRVARLTKASFV